jgi:hypothetical protein
MDNEAQDYDDGAKGSDAKTSVRDADALESKLKGWFKADYNSKGQTTWRKEAREDYGFEAGDSPTTTRRFCKKPAAPS